MAAAAAEVYVGLTSQPGVVLGHRLDDELRFGK
jgi:thiamine pyrophosphate-dependent acetolactate synthase large subunit-like protein